ncbi:MAG TPA: hypothetical protein VM450_19730 [Thermomicrobiales bacterium]|nr:hypothetical protein [Thermomicrobiales bacterium]
MSASRAADPHKTYLWCDTCRRSYRHDEVVDGHCPVCGNETRPMGKFSAILRGLMSNELAASPLESRHRQLVRLIWTHNGMGEQYYRVIAPEMSYNRFEARVTEILCQGAEEGWVRFVLPPAPRAEESAYKLELVDEERFIAELQALAGPDAAIEEGN